MVHNTKMMCYHVKMLPMGHAVYVDTSFSQDGQCCLARGVFLSRYSRVRCNVPSKVLAIAHATMTLLLVAPLRLSFKDKRKYTSLIALGWCKLRCNLRIDLHFSKCKLHLIAEKGRLWCKSRFQSAEKGRFGCKSRFQSANGKCDLHLEWCKWQANLYFEWGGELGSGRLLAAPPGNRSCAFRCSDFCLRLLCARDCDDIRYLYGLKCYCIMIWSMLCPALSVSVSLCV